MSATEKIHKIIDLAKKQSLEANIQPIVDIFDKELRNAIFHSDYCLYDDEIRLPKASMVHKVEDVMALLNKTMAYFEVVTELVKMYKASYDKPEVIDPHPDFSPDPDHKFIVMVRKGTGVIGIKSNWTNEEIAKGKIPVSVIRMLPYEQKLLRKNPSIVEFPENKVKKWNKILKVFPVIIRKILLPITEKFL